LSVLPDVLDIREVFAADGPVAGCLAGFEVRPQQTEMAAAVQRCLEAGGRMVVEAGTGIGKSFAYLVAAIDQVRRKKGRVLVSTFTITLQEQLIQKDIPLLSGVFPQQFVPSLAKGRANYLCLRRLDFATKRQYSLFHDVGALSVLRTWADATQDGSLSQLDVSIPAQLLDAVKSEHGNCRGRKCQHFRKCFYYRARRKLETADIIVANHALLFSDLVLKGQDAPGVLPDYQFVIIDEAHNIEHVAEDRFGLNITEYRISQLLNTLYNHRTRKGLLAFSDQPRTITLVVQCSAAVKLFFRQIRQWYEHSQQVAWPTVRCRPGFVEDSVTGPLKKLRLALAAVARKLDDEDEKAELALQIQRCKDLELQIVFFLTQSETDCVYWVEAETTGSSRRAGQAAASGPDRIALRSAPLNVGPYVKKLLFDQYQAVVLTSATLSCNNIDEAGFTFFASRVGLQDYQALKLGSPFDYEQQVTMYVEKDLPDPNDEAFEPAAAEAIKKYIQLTVGKAFVLFTSYEMLGAMAEKLSGWFVENNITLLQQGAGLDRTTLLAQFRSDTNSVLFGTDSFWQGVDVPGEALSNVIIVRLPFAVPNHPLIEARLEQIRLEGENPFLSYQLPAAIIKFKQGFGRLIRNKTDRGIIVVLDSRIVHKSYGRQFLSAIPRCNLRIVPDRP
jgi:ATP-dependent DNA helicase DinG